MGNVGTALARFPPFNSGPFRVVAGFDSDPHKIGRRIGSVAVHDLVELPAVVASTGARMAILAVPAGAADLAFRSLVGAGIRSILSFAPVTLSPSPGCRVKNVDLRIHLEELAFFLASAGGPGAGV
jgi:redox-sensing transcriptional repressor